MKRKIHFIGAPEYLGGPKSGPQFGPTVIQESGLLNELKQDFGIDTQWTDVAYSSDPIAAVPATLAAMSSIGEHSRSLYQAVYNSTKNQELPFVIGGDHTIAVGTWSGIADVLALEKSTGESKRRGLGLIWLDAHMDAHTPETSHSKAIHGMPVASLLGYGDPLLSQVGSTQPKVLPQNLVLLGIRSFEDEEAEFLVSLGVRIIKMEEVKKRGFRATFDEALGIVQKNTAGFGLSIDMDGFDPKDAPGVSTPVKKGLARLEVIPVLRGLCAQQPLLRGIEIAELNPLLDNKVGLTVQFTKELVTALLSPP